MNMKILYIEDDITHIDFFKYICREENKKEDIKIELDTANTFEEAIELLNRDIQYDVCLTDLGLSGEMGLELVEGFPKYNWFVITAMTRDVVISQLGNHPLIKKIFFKPYPKDELILELEDFVKNLNIIPWKEK